MTSKPASRSARAMILAPRSCPSRPGLAITTRILLATAAPVYERGSSGLWGARRAGALGAPGRARDLVGSRSAAGAAPDVRERVRGSRVRAGESVLGCPDG